MAQEKTVDLREQEEIWENANPESPLELSVLAGEILLYNGAEIFRVQETMERIAKAYRMDSFHVYVISNGIFACGTENGVVHTAEIRAVSLAPTHLGRIAAVNQLSREIEEGKYTVPHAFQRLEDIKALPFASKWFRLLACAVGSAGFCYLLGGTLWDSFASFFTGLLLYLFLLMKGTQKLSKIMTNILGSGLVTLCSVLLYMLGIGHHIDHMVIGSIIPLVPGVAFTTSIRDFFNGDYVSGAIRLIDALLIAACIALGVGFVLRTASAWFGVVL